MFRAYQIKLKPEDERAVKIKSVRRHPSNDIDLYFDTATHATKVKELPKTGIQGFLKHSE